MPVDNMLWVYNNYDGDGAYNEQEHRLDGVNGDARIRHS